MRREAAVAAVVLVGCGPSAYEQAAGRWAAATGLPMPADTVVTEAATPTVPCGRVAGAVGCTRGHRVVLGAGAEPYVLLHELGHVLGAAHDDHGVMVPARDAAGWRPCLTADDLWLVPAARWHRAECGP